MSQYIPVRRVAAGGLNAVAVDHSARPDIRVGQRTATLVPAARLLRSGPNLRRNQAKRPVAPALVGKKENHTSLSLAMTNFEQNYFTMNSFWQSDY
jgi:hypothetical protein